MSGESFEITVSEVSDMEARVTVRYAGETTELRGLLRGPYCATAHTLPAEYPLRRGDAPGTAVVVVTDPCLWSRELPHLYRVEVRALQGAEVVAEYHGEIGLRDVGRPGRGICDVSRG